jgi:hypothetical protein
VVARTFVILPDDLEGRDGHFNGALKVDPSSCLLGICEELQNARSAFYFEHKTKRPVCPLAKTSSFTSTGGL